MAPNWIFPANCAALLSLFHPAAAKKMFIVRHVNVVILAERRQPFLQRHYYIAVEVGAGETDSKIRTTETQAGLNRVGGVNQKKNEKNINKLLA